jgi:hypothetical protein
MSFYNTHLIGYYKAFLRKMNRNPDPLIDEKRPIVEDTSIVVDEAEAKWKLSNRLASNPVDANG